MKIIDGLVAEYAERRAGRRHLPEHRQLELYSKKRQLRFADEDPRTTEAPSLLGVLLAGSLLDAWHDGRDPSREGQGGWARYLGLPRATGVEKLVAELTRLLRVVRLAAVHADGKIEHADGIVRLRCVFNRCALSLDITPVGLELLEASVLYFLDAQRQPYGEAYVEAMLGQYFADLVGEVKRFSDEDRILYQFRVRRPFNRHLRFDCDNPKFELTEDALTIEVGAFHADSARYPIDFYLVLDDALHIIPVEALVAGRLARSELGTWRSRLALGAGLPARFRARFWRETVVSGLPMT